MAAKLCRDCPMGINGLWPICKTERPRLGCGAHSNAAGVPYDTTRPPVGSAANLTADNQMTRKPNLALNAEIVRSGRAANCATTTARDPEIIDPITVECVKWLERNTETLRSGAAWDKRSREQLADRDRWEHSAKEQPLEVRQAVAERIKAETHRIRLQVPRLRLVNAKTPMQSITEGRRD